MVAPPELVADEEMTAEEVAQRYELAIARLPESIPVLSTNQAVPRHVQPILDRSRAKTIADAYVDVNSYFLSSFDIG